MLRRQLPVATALTEKIFGHRALRSQTRPGRSHPEGHAILLVQPPQHPRYKPAGETIPRAADVHHVLLLHHWVMAHLDLPLFLHPQQGFGCAVPPGDHQPPRAQGHYYDGNVALEAAREVRRQLDFLGDGRGSADVEDTGDGLQLEQVGSDELYGGPGTVVEGFVCHADVRWLVEDCKSMGWFVII